MNITFMIGNGFDIGLGLRSRFKDFFPIYTEKSQNKKAEIRRLSEEIKADYDTWSQFEEQMGQYTEKFDANNKQLYHLQFRDFQTEFVAYLKQEEDQLSFDDARKISQVMISGLTNFYSVNNLRNGSNNAMQNAMNGFGNQDRYYHFISFNYTMALEKCLKTIPNGILKSSGNTAYKIGQIIHVHGTYDNAPIMGVDDVSQIANSELAKDQRFIQYLVKPTLNSLHRTNQDVDAANMISSSNIIGIYGMSLGPTDKHWWVRVLQWLNGNPGRQLVIFDYDPDFRMASQFDWIDKEDSLIDKLAGYVTNTKIDLANLRPRIHLAVHKNIFQMNLRKKEKDQYATLIELAEASVKDADSQTHETLLSTIAGK